MDENTQAQGSELSGGLGPSLTFADALRIARGCMDYGGGYQGHEYEIFHHGIQTVINSLGAAQNKGLVDHQVRMLHQMGSA